jgi:hypothetical protein
MKFFILFLHQVSKIIWHLIPKQIQKLFLGISGELNIYDIYKKEEILNSYNYYKKYLQTSVVLEHTDEIRRYSVINSLENDKENVKYNLEFGVYTGRSINLFSKYCKKVYGFDSFEGLSHDWIGTRIARGHLNLNKKLPKVNYNVSVIQGKVEETLENFLRQHSPVINFVHLDLDIYEPTVYVLKKIKPFLDSKAIILFDQLYNYPGWELGEHRALNEVFSKEQYSFIAFCTTGSQASIKLKL